MRLPRILTTSSFRLALLYLALFSISVFGLLAFVYWSTAGFIGKQTDDTIGAEITGLAEQYRLTGIAGLTAIVIERSRNQRESLYLLASGARRPLAGNLDSWPGAPTTGDGWIDFSYQRQVGGETVTHSARARHVLLPNGFHLLVGRDVEERKQIGNLIRDAVTWAVALTLGLGLAGGLLISRNLLRRIEAVNAASRGIMAGDLSRRVRLGRGGDELDELAANVNAMLDQIERLLNGMRQVTDNIAHDLRGPLHRMRTRLEVTLAQNDDPAGLRAALQDTVVEAESLLNTFNAVLSIAELEAGAALPNREQLDFSRLVADVADLYAPVAEERGLSFASEVAEGLRVSGERHLLSQALSNLIDNAIKYTPDGGAIRIAARLTGACCEAVVADSGPGIPAGDRDRVQDRFVRLEASRNLPGSGLGLSLVRAVARVHGGLLRLEDNGPGLRAVLALPAA